MTGWRFDMNGCLSSASRYQRDKSKRWGSLIGALCMFASLQVSAQVCEAEIARERGAYAAAGSNRPIPLDEEKRNVSRYLQDKNYWGTRMPCPDARGTCRAYALGTTPIPAPDSPGYADALRLLATVFTQDAGIENDPREIYRKLAMACVARHMASEAKGGTTTTAAPGPNSAKLSSSTYASSESTQSASSNSSTNAGPVFEGMHKQLSDAMALAEKRQADTDRARRGKPKRHVIGAEANECLKPHPGNGVTNACPYAVEYIYCVSRPEKDSWSEAFNCDSNKFGSWQVGPGPGSHSIMHSEGETTYWFACKYGPSLHKPDGISPVDVTYEPGRGLTGRCGEWGSSNRS